MDKIAWHEHCVLRDDVRQGTLTLAEFAATGFGKSLAKSLTE